MWRPASAGLFAHDRALQLTRTQSISARLIAGLATPLIGALCRTLTWIVEGQEHYDALMRRGTPPVLAFWHGRILPATWHFRNQHVVVITSQNFDGEWIARIIERFGYGTARGSSSRGGARALVQMRRDLSAGRPVAFTVDGPRGPFQVAQPGAAFLAGATGHPLLPFHIEVSRYWTTRSWDRPQIPRPFSRVAVVIGAPFNVQSTNDDVVEESRVRLEHTLKALEARAHELLTAALPTVDAGVAGTGASRGDRGEAERR